MNSSIYYIYTYGVCICIYMLIQYAECLAKNEIYTLAIMCQYQSNWNLNGLFYKFYNYPVYFFYLKRLYTVTVYL